MDAGYACALIAEEAPGGAHGLAVQWPANKRALTFRPVNTDLGRLALSKITKKC